MFAWEREWIPIDSNRIIEFIPNGDWHGIVGKRTRKSGTLSHASLQIPRRYERARPTRLGLGMSQLFRRIRSLVGAYSRLAHVQLGRSASAKLSLASTKYTRTSFGRKVNKQVVECKFIKVWNRIVFNLFRKKEVGSTDGMKESVRTSELLKFRVKLVEEERLSQMHEFLKARDFHSMATLTMKGLCIFMF